MRDRVIDRWVVSALVCYSLGVAVLLMLAGMPTTYDDGFYYFKIAQQVARGAGSTFDGLHPTNGYHPLWLLCLVPIFWLAPAPTPALIAGTMVQAILMAAGAGLLYRIARLSFGRFAASLAALLWVSCTYRLALSGLEWSLHTLGLLAAAYVYLRWFVARPSLRACLALGLLMGLTFLARIDTIGLAALFGLSLWWRESRRGLTGAGVARLLAFGSPVLIVVLAYIGANLWLVGHPLPVSGVVKRLWSAELLAQDPRSLAYGWPVAKLAHLFWPFSDLRDNLAGLLGQYGDGLSAALGYLLYSTYMIIGTFGAAGVFLAGALARPCWPWRRWFSRTLRPWGPLVLFSLLDLFGYALLYHGGLSTTTWYYGIQPCLAAVLIAALVDWLAASPEGDAQVYGRRPQSRLMRLRPAAHLRGRQVSFRPRRWTVGGMPRVPSGRRDLGRRPRVYKLMLPLLVAGWLSVALYPLWSIRQLHEARRLGLARQPLYDTAQWVSAHLPAGAVIGAWNAGTIGYLSGRRVVNLDGLVNSWDYALVQRTSLCQYWGETGITYLADAFTNRHAISVVPAFPAYAACADRLQLIWADQYGGGAGRMEIYQIR